MLFKDREKKLKKNLQKINVYICSFSKTTAQTITPKTKKNKPQQPSTQTYLGEGGGVGKRNGGSGEVDYRNQRQLASTKTCMIFVINA